MTDVTTDTFEKEVLRSDLRTVVDFWAPWCGPCRMMAPIFEELDAEFSESVKFCKVNVDDEGELAQGFEVMSIPTLLIFEGGKPVDKIVGLKSKQSLMDILGLSAK